MAKNEIVTQTVYFEKPGAANTDRVLELARDRAAVLGIDTFIIATTEGDTPLRAAEVLPADADVIAVSHSAGFKAPYSQELSDEAREALADAGVRVLTCTHGFGGVGRAIRKKLDTYQSEEIIAYTLRIFGQGMKVVPEVAIMVADSGYICEACPVMVIAGTGRGADTAVILEPTHAQTFFDIKIMEIVCMPSPHHPLFE